MLNEVIDFRGQVLDAPKGAPSNRLLSDQVEPDLHLVKPGGVGRRQMDVSHDSGSSGLLQEIFDFFCN